MEKLPLPSLINPKIIICMKAGLDARSWPIIILDSSKFTPIIKIDLIILGSYTRVKFK